MSIDPIVSRLKDALDVAPPDPAFRARVISSLPPGRRQPRVRRLALAVPVAVVLIVAIALGLISAGAFRLGRPLYNGAGAVGDCRLPVYGATRPGVYKEGFLDLATGTFTPATSASRAYADQIQGEIVNWQGPNQGISYDPVVDRWLPVPLAWVAQDGLSYAYVTGPADAMAVHVKDLATGADRTLPVDPVARFFGWANARLYYTHEF